MTSSTETVRWPDTGANSGVIQRLAETALRQPDALAVAAPDATLTYAQVWGRASILARQLRAAGVGRNDLVALCVERGADLVVGAAGIMAAGAVHVALDPSQPHARLTFMLRDSGARVLVARSEVSELLKAEHCVAPPHTDDAVDRSFEWAAAKPDDPAYVVYTSGSTGEPKGVLVEHASLENLVAWHGRAFGLTSADRTSLVANPGFDAIVWELWPSLTAGASLHIVPEQLKQDPVALRDWLIAERVTTAFLPTPLAEEVIRLHWPERVPLRYLLTGGDVLHRRPPADLPFALVNNYGVSEAAVVSTSGNVNTAHLDAERLPTIGSPITGVILRVVGDDGAVLPAGTVGELIICGVSVARGYLGRPELSAARFVADPCSPERRAYRTGDLARIRDDGEVEFVGRKDDQMQVRGFRIEPEEIVAILDRHPAVEASAVLASVDTADPQLIAYVVTGRDYQLETDELRGHLTRHLPGYMVPHRFRAVPTLPVTSNGKVDRATLELLADESAQRKALAPRTDVEAAVASMVAERLGVPRVDIEDNFFLLGGHSMLGAQLIIRISERFGIEMPLRSLFEHPTIIELSAEVERLVTEQISAMSDSELLEAAAGLTSP